MPDHLLPAGVTVLASLIFLHTSVAAARRFIGAPPSESIAVHILVFLAPEHPADD